MAEKHNAPRLSSEQRANPESADLALFLHRLDLAVEVVNKKIERIYCLATAGEFMLREESGTPHGLFDAISDLASSNDAEMGVSIALDELAAAIGAGRVKHG